MSVDYFTKVAQLYFVPKKPSLTVARAYYHGLFQKITFGSGNECKVQFRHMLHRSRIPHIFTSSNHLNATEPVERVNHNVKRILSSHFNEDPTDWVGVIHVCVP